MLCICCGASEWRLVTTLPRLIFGISARIERCSGCGFGRTVPAPNTFFDHYAAEGDSISNFQQRADDYRMFARELLRDAPIQSGRLLDVGCGGGFLVEEAQRLGFDAIGIEANGAIVKWCRSRGLAVFQQDASQFDAKEKFDLIVISAVLEHLEDPVKLLTEAGGMLSPNGSVLVSQASFDGLVPRVLPWLWYGWQPHEHFWHFTPKSFQALASRNGFNAKIIRNSLHHGWYLSGKNIVRNSATLLARLGKAIGKGDSFNAIVSS